MPSTSTDLTVLDEAMKVIASEPLFNNVLAESQFMDIFPTDSRVQRDQTTGGRYIERAHITGLPAGFGARKEGDYLPEADDPEFVNSRIPLRSTYGTLEMTGHLMRRCVGDEGAFTDYAREAFPLFAKRVATERDRIYASYGFGIKARCTQALQVSGGDYTVIVDSAHGVPGWGDPWPLFLRGERLVFSDTATGTALRNAGAAQSAKVQNVAHSEAGVTTLTLSGVDAALAAAVANDDFIFPGDGAGFSGQGPAGVNREPQGVTAGVDDGGILGTYLNIVRSALEEWKASVIDSTDATLGFGGVFSEKLLNFADDEVMQNSGAKIDVIIASVNANRSYWNSLLSDSFFVGRQGMLGGKDDPQFCLINGRKVPIKVVRKVPPQVAFGLSLSCWKLFTLRTWEWDDKTGSIWNRVVNATGRKDAYFAVGGLDEELACSHPNYNFRIDNLAKVY